MKKLFILVSLGLVYIALKYSAFLVPYFFELLTFLAYLLIGIALLILGIYIKDRIAYYKLKKQMWEKAPGDYSN